MHRQDFGENFIFGVGTSSYQIEGATHEDGRVPSIWDTYCATPGLVFAGDTGDKACDSYHLWKNDIELLKDLGVDAYRFSVAMPRIITDQSGSVNKIGLDYYERLIDGLLEANIKPVVTLYHWDLPQYLEDNGGWLNRDTAYALEYYTQIVVKQFGDRVSMWTTLNEPWCSAFLGYGTTEHAPGLAKGPAAFKAAHHLNLAHGLMSKTIRECASKSAVSIVLNPQYFRGDAGAAHRLNLIANRIFLDPIIRKHYPQELLALTSNICDWKFVHDGDLEIINQAPDVLGINYYSSNLVSMRDPDAKVVYSGASAFPGSDGIDWLQTPGEHTIMGWNIDPEGLYDLLIRYHDEYGLPLMVTENGMAANDHIVSEESTNAVHDHERISFIKRHLDELLKAQRDGANIRGYFAWSLMDNFEWSQGYSKRFGLCYVDWKNEQRIPKDSFKWFRALISKQRR